MTDFAATIIGALTAPRTTRAKTAQSVMSEFDGDGDGKVTGQEFQKVFAILQRTEDLSGGHGGGRSANFHAAGVRPTIFECTLYPSFSRNFALSQYQAMDMLTTYDVNKDKVVTLDELSGVDSTPPTTTPPATDPATGDSETTPATDPVTDPDTDPVTDPITDPTTDPVTPPPPPPPTASERADALMALYDTTDKGYVTLEDIASAWILDPSLGDISQLANIVQAWDVDSDGKITRGEVLSVFTIMDTVDTLMAQMGQAPKDPASGTGPTIPLANVTDDQLAQLDLSRDMLNAWDTGKDGSLTRAELIEGLRALARQAAPPPPTAADYAKAMLASFDANKDGALGLEEFTQAVAADNMDAAAAKSAFDSWDANQDGSISGDELTSGVDAVRNATDLMANYDLARKGYFDITDLQRVLDATPSDGARPSAQEFMAAWDLDGDGHVTTQELVTGLMMQKQSQAEASTPETQTTLPSA